MVSVGTKIKEARISKGYSQAQVEDKLGWGRGSLSKYEKDQIKISEERKKQVYTYLGIVELNVDSNTNSIMGEAIKKAMIKYTDHLPGEVWIHKRSSGASLNKLILNINGNMAYCITVFSNSSRNTDFKIKDTTGATKYAAVDRLESIRLKELEKRNGIISTKSVEDLKLHVAAIYGIAVVQKEIEVPVEKIVEKEVVKEVPVEKIVEVEKEVIKEVPVEVNDTELKILKTERDIYKDMVDRLLPKIERR